MIKLILTLSIVFSGAAALASNDFVIKSENIDMKTYQTRILSNQEMIFIGQKEIVAKRVDKLSQHKNIFVPWATIIKSAD